MALPTLVKTWQHNVNNAQPALGVTQNNRHLLRIIKDALKAFAANPWTVSYSCSSAVAGAAGDGVDRWVTDANVVSTNNAANPRSWIVLKQPAIHANYEILLHGFASSSTASANFNHLEIWVSAGAGFTGGTTTTRPTATDEAQLMANSWTALGGSNSAVDIASRWSVSQSNDGQCTRVWGASAGAINFFWCFEKPDNPTVGWATPSVSFARAGRPTHVWAVSAAGKMRHGAAIGDVMMGCESAGDTILPLATAGLSANDISAEWPIIPIGVSSASVGTKGRHGTLFDMWFGSSSITDGDSYPNTGTNQFIQVGGIVLPWNGGAINLS